MAMSKRVTTARAPRRVSLKRGGSDSANRRQAKAKPEDQKPARKISINIPWRGLGKSFMTAGIIGLAVILLAGISVGLIYGYRYATSSNYFSVKTIDVHGNSRLTSREILEVAGIEDGANALAISIDDVERALAGHTWVKEVSVKRVLPDTLVITIEERTPHFWMVDGETLNYADAHGQVIAPVAPGQFEVLPLLEIENGAEEAASSLPDLLRSFAGADLPSEMLAIRLVRLSAARGVEVFLENINLTITIGLEEWSANLERLGRTVADLHRRGELGIIRQIKAEGSNVWVVRAG